jgi:hypothetical protein
MSNPNSEHKVEGGPHPSLAKKIDWVITPEDSVKLFETFVSQLVGVKFESIGFSPSGYDAAMTIEVAA